MKPYQGKLLAVVLLTYKAGENKLCYEQELPWSEIIVSFERQLIEQLSTKSGQLIVKHDVN